MREQDGHVPSPIGRHRRALLAMAGATGLALAWPGAASRPARATEAPITVDRIETDDDAPQITRPQADVTIVLFSDYQCPYCRRLHPVIRQFVAEDSKVHLIYRDWPIFGGPSVEAARLAIASQYQGKHEVFDDALMAMLGKLTPESIRAAADLAGVDWTRLQADAAAHRDTIDALLARTDRYAEALGFQGTPGLLIGHYALPGAVDLDGLEKAVAMVRRKVTAGAVPQRGSSDSGPTTEK